MMTRIVFVHGMNNEGEDQRTLKAKWLDALRAGWRGAGVAEPDGYEADLPYYGDVLHDLTRRVRHAGGARRRGLAGAGREIGAFEQEYYRALKDRLALSDSEVFEHFPSDLREKGVANWEWVQAIARAVQARFPLIAEAALKIVPQVDGYLNRRAVRRAVDDIVRPSLGRGRTVVVAHSLGTIVSFRLLKELSGNLDIPLFLTLGSPLGIGAVERRIRPIFPPEIMAAWINAADERDYVALVSRLEPPSFPPLIRNITHMRNAGDDAHAITAYLKQPELAAAIAAALR